MESKQEVMTARLTEMMRQSLGPFEKDMLRDCLDKITRGKDCSDVIAFFKLDKIYDAIVASESTGTETKRGDGRLGTERELTFTEALLWMLYFNANPWIEASVSTEDVTRFGLSAERVLCENFHYDNKFDRQSHSFKDIGIRASILTEDRYLSYDDGEWKTTPIPTDTSYALLNELRRLYELNPIDKVIFGDYHKAMFLTNAAAMLGVQPYSLRMIQLDVWLYIYLFMARRPENVIRNYGLLRRKVFNLNIDDLISAIGFLSFCGMGITSGGYRLFGDQPYYFSATETHYQASHDYIMRGFHEHFKGMVLSVDNKTLAHNMLLNLDSKDFKKLKDYCTNLKNTPTGAKLYRLMERVSYAAKIFLMRKNSILCDESEFSAFR